MALASTASPVSFAAEAALASFQMELERSLADLLVLQDEAAMDPRWSRAMVEVRAYTLRRAKRVRPTLLLTGWAMASGDLMRGIPEGVKTFSAGLELLHTFMLVHDDVADRAETRRGGPSLHRLLATGKAGEDLAVVVGDYLYARAVEVMLGSGMPHAAEATQYMMAICRHTAVGQYLDLDLGRTPLQDVTIFQTLKVANLKTARYGFVAPLVVGAMLGGGDKTLRDQLERIGRQVGMAFQLRDDLIGLFGEDDCAGKAGGGDFIERKRTFPVVAAWTRADAQGRAHLENLWNAEVRDERALASARAALETWGGRQATQRVIERMTRGARRMLQQLPAGSGARTMLDGLMARMVERTR
jgi:geranylgeranyl diphosphate synthase, type I